MEHGAGGDAETRGSGVADGLDCPIEGAGDASEGLMRLGRSPMQRDEKTPKSWRGAQQVNQFVGIGPAGPGDRFEFLTCPGCLAPWAFPVDPDRPGAPAMPLVNSVAYGATNGPICKFSTFMATAQLARSVDIPIIASGGLGNPQNT